MHGDAPHRPSATRSFRVTLSDPHRRKLLALLYLAGFLIAVDQLADVLVTVLSTPVAFDSVQWRFGVFGLLATRTSVLLMAEVMVFAAAVGLDHRNLLAGLGVLNLVLAVCVLAGLVLFALDALQLRSMVRAGSALRYDSATLRAAGVALFAGILLAWSGIASLAAAGVLVLLHQLSDAATALRGADLHTPGGRLQIVGMIGTRAVALMTADVLLIWSALALSHGPALRILAMVHLVLGGLALVAVPFFVIDAGALANTVGGRALPTYRVFVARILGFLLAGGVAGLIAGRRLVSISPGPVPERGPVADR